MDFNTPVFHLSIAISIYWVFIIVDLRINETRQTGAVTNRTYRGDAMLFVSFLSVSRQTGAVTNRTYRGAKVSIYF